jgi:hypothetical protein
MIKIKFISFILTLILIPLFINLIANYTTWFRTKARTEMTLTLDDHFTLGSIMESNLPDLALTWEGKPIENIMKISWRVKNSGTKGILSFEHGPIIAYPMNVIVASSTISLTSPMLKINKSIVIDPIERNISVEDLGIFNPEDFFLVDVYVTDVPDSTISPEFFDGWNLEAKALDLDIRKELATATSQAETRTKKRLWWLYVVGVLATMAAYSTTKIVATVYNIKRKGKQKKSIYPLYNEELEATQ